MPLQQPIIDIRADVNQVNVIDAAFPYEINGNATIAASQGYWRYTLVKFEVSFFSLMLLEMKEFRIHSHTFNVSKSAIFALLTKTLAYPVYRICLLHTFA